MTFTTIKGTNIDSTTTINVSNIIIANNAVPNQANVVQQIKDEVQYFINLHQQDELSILTGTARWYAPFDLQVNTINARLGTAADATVTALIKKNDITAKTITFGANSPVANIANQTISMTSGDYLTVDVTTIGTGVKGSNLYIQLGYNKL